VGVRSRSKKEGLWWFDGGGEGSGRGQPDALIGASAKVLGSARKCFARVRSGVWVALGLLGMTISRSSVSNKAWISKWYERRRREDGEEAFVERGMVSKYSEERKKADGVKMMYLRSRRSIGGRRSCSSLQLSLSPSRFSSYSSPSQSLIMQVWWLINKYPIPSARLR
jgi:hypothetical protein